jgi:hypothetical protein
MGCQPHDQHSKRGPEINGPIAVQLGTAVARGAYFTRYELDLSRAAQALDYVMTAGNLGGVVFRDGVVLTSEGWDGFDSPSVPYLYVPNASGGFDHVGILRNGTRSADFDIMAGTIVSAGKRWLRPVPVAVYVLPQTLVAPLRLPTIRCAECRWIHADAGQRLRAGGQFVQLLLPANGCGEGHGRGVQRHRLELLPGH